VTTAGLADEHRLEVIHRRSVQTTPTRILGIVLGQPSEIEQQSKGLRFMGQRFVPEATSLASSFTRTWHRLSPARPAQGPGSAGSDGSGRAYQILEGTGETAYENYPQQMAKMRAWCRA